MKILKLLSLLFLSVLFGLTIEAKANSPDFSDKTIFAPTQEVIFIQDQSNYEIKKGTLYPLLNYSHSNKSLYSFGKSNLSKYPNLSLQSKNFDCINKLLSY